MKQTLELRDRYMPGKVLKLSIEQSSTVTIILDDMLFQVDLGQLVYAVQALDAHAKGAITKTAKEAI